MKQWLKPKIAATLLLTTACLILFQMFIALLHQVSDIDYKADFLAFCRNMILDVTIGHSFLELILLLLSLFTAYRMVFFMFRQFRLRKGWTNYVNTRCHSKLTKKFTSKYKSWNTPIFVIEEQLPLALVEGWIYPKIVISTGLLELLTPHEVQAVLLHERYHCLHRHPMKKYLIRIVISSIPFVPILKGLGQFYNVWIEILADRYVLHRTHSPLVLGSALLKLIKSNRFVYPLHAVSFADGAINYRLSQVIDRNKTINVPVLSANSVISSLIVLLGMYMIIFFHCFGWVI